MGAIIAAAISGVIGWGVKKLTESTFTAVVCTGLFMGAMTLLPFSIELPNAMYHGLKSENISTFFGAVGYMVPLKDILVCICFIILCRYSGLLWGLGLKIFNWIGKTVGGGQ